MWRQCIRSGLSGARGEHVALSAAVCAVLGTSELASAQGRCPASSIAGELFTGTAWSAPLPLIAHLPTGAVRLRARYSTRPFADAPYYSYRLGRSRANGQGVEIEMLHHKLYLENPRPPIERFEVTHGYNLPMVNASSRGRRWQWRVGIGVVIAHPEGRIGGREIGGARTVLGGGYHIAGLTAQLATGRRYALWRGRTVVTAAPEAKLTASWARVALSPGVLHIPNAALHLLGGLGVRHCSDD